MYKVNYNGRTSYVSSYFYYRVRPLHDAERDLLMIAKFLVFLTLCYAWAPEANVDWYGEILPSLPSLPCPPSLPFPSP